MDPKKVSVARSDNPSYPSIPPFNPYIKYNEYLFSSFGDEPNYAYEAVRHSFYLSGLDSNNYGTASWNPLGTLISPGETVLLKPNLVKESHPRDPNGWVYVLTHGSMIRALADYVWKALDGKGKIIVADAPQTDSSFDKIVKILGLDVIRDFYLENGLDFELRDLRKEEWQSQDGVIVNRKHLAGDPEGYVAFDLSDRSEFSKHRGEGNYYGADYDSREVNRHHSDGRHEYLIAGTAIACDVFFNVPKLKTHKKTGVTISLKNLVGINGDKNWLPHHTEGAPDQGGDEHPNPSVFHRFERKILPLFRSLSITVPVLGAWIFRRAKKAGTLVFGDTEQVIRSGNWWGNDTTWRMCLDLNKILLYGKKDGSFRSDKTSSRKRYFSLVDGIVAGEGSGPMNPDPIRAGVVLFGTDPVSVDAVGSYLMGFNPNLIPIIKNAFLCKQLPLVEWNLSDIKIVSNNPFWNGYLTEVPRKSTLHFKPHFGWAKKIEHDVDRNK